MSIDKRNAILADLAKHTGKIVPWQFIKKTSYYLPHIDRFHNLITGIFKPAWSDYALSIIIRTTSPYDSKDEVIFLDDGRWIITYSPRSGGLQMADNRALVKCMDDHIPIGVFYQLTDKTNRELGSTYRILGLGLITGFDPNNEIFYVNSVDQHALELITNSIIDETSRHEVLLYAQVMNKFQPFVKEGNLPYQTSMTPREKAFREIVIREYDYTCAVCEMKFLWHELTETTAAHIIPKYKQGTDDPRNGLSLCRTHHWAFDEGFYTLSDSNEILLSPLVYEAKIQKFSLITMENKPILLPKHSVFQPHPEAVKWHRDNIWRN